MGIRFSLGRGENEASEMRMGGVEKEVAEEGSRFREVGIQQPPPQNSHTSSGRGAAHWGGSPWQGCRRPAVEWGGPPPPTTAFSQIFSLNKCTQHRSRRERIWGSKIEGLLDLDPGPVLGPYTLTCPNGTYHLSLCLLASWGG